MPILKKLLILSFSLLGSLSWGQGTALDEQITQDLKSLHNMTWELGTLDLSSSPGPIVALQAEKQKMQFRYVDPSQKLSRSFCYGQIPNNGGIASTFLAPSGKSFCVSGESKLSKYFLQSIPEEQRTEVLDHMRTITTQKYVGVILAHVRRALAGKKFFLKSTQLELLAYASSSGMASYSLKFNLVEPRLLSTRSCKMIIAVDSEQSAAEMVSLGSLFCQ